MDFVLVINQILTLFILLIVGYVITKLKIINEPFIDTLSSFLLKVTLPALIISSMQLKDFSKEILVEMGILIFISCIVYGVSILFAIFIPNLLKVPINEKGLYQFICVFANTGFIGYPVVEAILGKEAIFYAAIYNLPFNFLAYTLGIYYIAKGKQDNKFSIKTCFNPGVIAVFIGFAIFISSIKLPMAIDKSITLIGDLTTPLSMIIVGALLTKVKVNKIFKNYRLYAISIYRLILFPLLVYIVLLQFNLDKNILATPVIISSLPVAVNSVILAKEYDNNYELASQSIFVSTLFSIFTIPLIAFIINM